MNVRTAVSAFLVAMAADGLAPKTIAWYRWSLDVLANEHGQRLLTEMDTATMRAYILSLRERQSRGNGRLRAESPDRLTDDTINAHMRCLHKFWTWTADEYDLVNPMRRIRYPRKPTPKPKAIAMPDVRLLFDAAGQSRAAGRDRALVAFMVDTGCRAGGVVGLTWDDLDLERQTAIVTEKGGKTRTVYFTPITLRLLMVWRAEGASRSGAVFPNIETGKPLTVSGLRLLLKRLGRRAGVTGRINPHSFRHSFAREYLRAGGDLSTLSRLMGHADVTTTVHHYAIFTADEVRQAHEKYSPAANLNDLVSE